MRISVALVEVSEKSSVFKGFWIAPEEQMLQLTLGRSLSGQVVSELVTLQQAVCFGDTHNLQPSEFLSVQRKGGKSDCKPSGGME